MPSAIRRIWQESARALRPDYPKTGPTRAARSSSGSTNRGPRGWRRTRRTGHSGEATKRMRGQQGSAAEPVSGLQHQGRRRRELTRKLAPITSIGSRIPDYDSYWKQWSIEENYANIQVPALVIAAWYDIFQGGSLRNYTGHSGAWGHGGGAHGTQLLVAIGGHSGSGRKVGTSILDPTRRLTRTPSRWIGTTTCSRASRTSLPTASRSRFL